MRLRTPQILVGALVAAAVTATLLTSVAPSPGSAATAAAAAAPGRPRSVDVDIRSGGLPGFTLFWSAPASGTPDGYEVLVDGDVRQRLEGTSRAALVTGLPRGRTYRLAVRTVDDGARSEAVGESLVLTYGAATPRLAANPTNPLAGLEWGAYLGRADDSYEPWLRAGGATKEALGQITLQPKAKWFGHWLSDAEAQPKVEQYIRDSTHGDPDVLSQMTLYRLTPWKETAHRRLPTEAERASYRRYVGGVARAIGDRPMAVVLQPDGAWMQGAPRGKGSLFSMLSWTVRTLEALPRTSVYLEIGSAHWLQQDPERALSLLLPSGIAQARGFALAVTHMDSTADSVRYGARVVAALAKRGIKDAHFVVDTADNGRGFSGADFRKVYPKSVPLDESKMCRTAKQKLCVALGIPPTTAVAHARWGLPADVRRLAARHVDAYLWINRPWLHHQTSPFVQSQALALADQNPFG